VLFENSVSDLEPKTARLRRKVELMNQKRAAKGIASVKEKSAKAAIKDYAT
jgi:hypothetical protein